MIQEEENVARPAVESDQQSMPKGKEDGESTISYESLDTDVYERVYVSSVISPQHFYVQKDKNIDFLDDLVEEINSLIEREELEKLPTVSKDIICAAPFDEDNRYYRGKITEILPDDKVNVFYVDYGDTGIVDKERIYSISAEHLLLPFQAIECALAGIKAPPEGWNEEAKSSLTRLTRDESYDMKVLKMMAYSNTSCDVSDNRFVVDLWDARNRITDNLLEEGIGIPELYIDDHQAEEEIDPEDRESTENFFNELAIMMCLERLHL